MNAKVILINNNNGMIAATSRDGDIIIIELLGYNHIEIGDIISHNDFHSMGRENYLNVTKRETFDVYVQNICRSLIEAKRQCSLT